MENDEIQVETQPEENEPEVELLLEEEPSDDTVETPEETPEVDWKAEALKQKAIAQRYAKKLFKGEVPTPKKDLPTKETDDIRLTVKELQMAEKKRQFGYEHGLSPEETDAVFKLSPNPTKEVLNDPFVKGGLAQLRAIKRVADNTPKSSSRSASFNIDPSKATGEDKQKALDEFVAKRFGR